MSFFVPLPSLELGEFVKASLSFTFKGLSTPAAILTWLWNSRSVTPSPQGNFYLHTPVVSNSTHLKLRNHPAFPICTNITVLQYLTSVHCPSLSPPSESDAYQVLYVFYKLSTHIHYHGAPDVLMPGLPPSSHTQTPPVTLESSFCHIPPTFMRLQALHCVEHMGRGGPSAIPVEHVGRRGRSAIPMEHMGHGGPSAIPKLSLLFPLCPLPDISSLQPLPGSSHWHLTAPWLATQSSRLACLSSSCSPLPTHTPKHWKCCWSCNQEPKSSPSNDPHPIPQPALLPWTLFVPLFIWMLPCADSWVTISADFFLTILSNCLNYKIVKIRSYLKLFFSSLDHQFIIKGYWAKWKGATFRARYQERALSEDILSPKSPQSPTCKL